MDKMSIAIITGASSGMGREFTRQASAEAMADEIWVVARRRERLEELQSELQTPLRIFECDLTQKADIDVLRLALEQEEPDVSLLINCAGFAKFGAVGQVSAADSLAMIDLNVRALVEITELVLPYMKQEARIIQIASTAAFQPLPEMNVYAATKAFVLSYSRALNVELEERGISVTAVCPGWTKTEFFDVAEKGANKEAVHQFPFMLTPQAVAKRAYKDAAKRRAVSIPGVINVGHFVFSRLMPASLIMTFWGLMK